MDSILDSIKKNLGIPLEETHFDGELIININSNISVLKQLGVGTPSFVVYDNSDLWSEFIDIDDLIPMATMFVYLKTKLILPITKVSEDKCFLNISFGMPFLRTIF